MQEGNYQVIITVYEANDLEPRGTNFLFFKTHKTACDAFVEVEVRGEVQRTKVIQIKRRSSPRRTTPYSTSPSSSNSTT